ncbi:MAG: hypothetical protein LCH67_14645 [Bacteroidetes bacterium]|nr:hypothetical protein [Bacteroidota bacterium]
MKNIIILILCSINFSIAQNLKPARILYSNNIPGNLIVKTITKDSVFGYLNTGHELKKAITDIKELETDSLFYRKSKYFQKNKLSKHLYHLNQASDRLNKKEIVVENYFLFFAGVNIGITNYFNLGIMYQFNPDSFKEWGRYAVIPKIFIPLDDNAYLSVTYVFSKANPRFILPDRTDLSGIQLHFSQNSISKLSIGLGGNYDRAALRPDESGTGVIQPVFSLNYSRKFRKGYAFLRENYFSRSADYNDYFHTYLNSFEINKKIKKVNLGIGFLGQLWIMKKSDIYNERLSYFGLPTLNFKYRIIEKNNSGKFIGRYY